MKATAIKHTDSALSVMARLGAVISCRPLGGRRPAIAPGAPPPALHRFRNDNDRVIDHMPMAITMAEVTRWCCGISHTREVL